VAPESPNELLKFRLEAEVLLLLLLPGLKPDPPSFDPHAPATAATSNGAHAPKRLRFNRIRCMRGCWSDERAK
jgi:hypothetical protein